jgi:hypothetical protein
VCGWCGKGIAESKMLSRVFKGKSVKMVKSCLSAGAHHVVWLDRDGRVRSVSLVATTARD